MRGLKLKIKRILEVVLLVASERAFWKIVGIVIGLILSNDLANEDWNLIGSEIHAALKMLAD